MKPIVQEKTLSRNSFKDNINEIQYISGFDSHICIFCDSK